MEEPLFAQEIKVEVKKEEPWGDQTQEVQPKGFIGGYYEDEEEKDYADCLNSEEPSRSTNSPAMSFESVDFTGKPKEYHGLSERIVSWEVAAGAQNAEDIMRQIDSGEETTVKEEDSGEENKEMLPSEPELFIGTLPFIFKCPVCRAGFHVSKAIQLHVAEQHGDKAPLCCPQCPAKYGREHCFWRHLRDTHRLLYPQDHPGGYLCDECGGFFRHRIGYAFYCEFSRGRPHFYCEHCQEAVNSCDRDAHKMTTKHRTARQPEEKWKMEPLAYCKPCGKVLGSEVWEKHQKKKKHKAVKMYFYCCGAPLCPEDWEEHQKSQWESTMREAKEIEAEVHKIKMEDSEEENKETLPSEEQAKPLEGTLPFIFKCPMCAVGFYLFSELRNHVNLQHPGQPHLWCDLCPKKYRMANSYWLHMKICKKEVCDCGNHQVAMKLSCLGCGKRGMDKRKYEEHREGLKEKPHAFCEPFGMVLDSDKWNSHQRVMGREGRVRFYC